MDHIEQQLIDAIDGWRDEMISLCSKLLQTPSVNGVHDERRMAEALDRAAQQFGLHTQIVGENPKRPNIVASTAPGGPTGLLLVGHTDTVPSGDMQHWTHPAFSGHVDEEAGRIYGRGAVDTKGGMTSALFALRALNEVPGALAKGRATFVGVPDEESGATGTLGIKWLDANGLLHGMGAIYAYSGNRIHLGHRGLVRYRIVCHGKANHTGNPGWQNRTDGVNAVTAMARLILALEAVETPYSSQPYFDRFRTVITPGTVISGGTAINIVPDRCEALIDVRTTPEFDFDDVQVTLHECIDGVVDAVPGARFEMSVTAQLPAALSDPDAPIFTVLASATEDLTGHTPERVVAGPANEGYLLIERGIPTVCGFGPAGDNFHAVDEYVEIDGLVEAAQIFAVTARRLAMTINR